MTSLSVNGEACTLDIEPDMPLLRALCDVLGVTRRAFQQLPLEPAA